jgi:hypothetical protein
MLTTLANPVLYGMLNDAFKEVVGNKLAIVFRFPIPCWLCDQIGPKFRHLVKNINQGHFHIPRYIYFCQI